MVNRWLALAVVVLGAAGCAAEPPTTPLKAAHLTLDGTTHTTRPAMCSQMQSYKTIDIPFPSGRAEAAVLLSGDRVIPQWVKIGNIDGFTGSFWQGGVGSARADVSNRTYTVTGSAYGINRSQPNKTVTTDFKIVAEC